MNWETFTWDTFWLGLTIGLWAAVFLRDIGNHFRRRK